MILPKHLIYFHRERTLIRERPRIDGKGNFVGLVIAAKTYAVDFPPTPQHYKFYKEHKVKQPRAIGHVYEPPPRFPLRFIAYAIPPPPPVPPTPPPSKDWETFTGKITYHPKPITDKYTPSSRQEVYVEDGATGDELWVLPDRVRDEDRAIKIGIGERFTFYAPDISKMFFCAKISWVKVKIIYYLV